MQLAASAPTPTLPVFVTLAMGLRFGLLCVFSCVARASPLADAFELFRFDVAPVVQAPKLVAAPYCASRFSFRLATAGLQLGESP